MAATITVPIYAPTADELRALAKRAGLSVESCAAQILARALSPVETRPPIPEGQVIGLTNEEMTEEEVTAFLGCEILAHRKEKRERCEAAH